MLVPRQLWSSQDSSVFRLVTKTWYKSTGSFTATSASASACSCQKEHRTFVVPCCTMALHTGAIFSLVWRSIAPGLSMTTAATQICCRSLTLLNVLKGTSGCTSGTSGHGCSVNLVATTFRPSVPFRRATSMSNRLPGQTELFLLGWRQRRLPDKVASACHLSLPMPRCKELRSDWWWQPNTPQPCEPSEAGLLMHLCLSFLSVGRVPERFVSWAVPADSKITILPATAVFLSPRYSEGFKHVLAIGVRPPLPMSLRGL